MIRIIHILPLALVALTATAQPQTDSLALSLRQCLDRGLKNNYELQIVRLDQQVAENNATLANAGALPSVNATAGYTGDLSSSKTKQGGVTSTNSNQLAHALRAQITADWMLFDGFKIQTNYKRLKELQRKSEVQTRVAIEDFVAESATAYFNVVRQRLRMKNLRESLELSRERLRIVRWRYKLGSASRLDLRSAEVDFNADSAQVLSQHEALITSYVDLQELMGSAAQYVDGRGFYIINPTDTAIALLPSISIDTLEQAMLRSNARLIAASSSERLSQLDYKAVQSRDYPYVKLAANYGYTYNNQSQSPSLQRHQWGGQIGVTVGMKIFDGQRQRERKNALVAIEQAQLATADLELTLRAQLERLWKSYINNHQLLGLAQENLRAAQEQYEAAQERFMLGDLSGIEMRQAEQNVLSARERLLDAQYSTKICEISLLQISGQVMNRLFT